MRGNNTIFCFDVGGIRVCHLGDLGHLLDDRQVKEIGNVDILLIPVGGYFTIDARAASQVCNQLKPSIIMPMHYKTEKGIPGVVGVDEFLKGKDNVSQQDLSEVEFKQGELPPPSQIIVLKPAL
jgi:L-ascorbate metabolism protein UlaG (beta-lactamase superfamily)